MSDPPTSVDGGSSLAVEDSGQMTDSASPAAPMLDASQGTETSVVARGTCETRGVPGGAECHTVDVVCEGLETIGADVAVYRPEPDVAHRGTIVFGSGGPGTAFYLGGNRTISQVRRQLLEAGYVLVDRRWHRNWFGRSAAGEGVGAASCRYAALLGWVRAELHEGGGLCATGNSGGASEVSYALSRWGADAMLDAAVITGGPPMARIDLGCLDAAVDPGWRERCAAIWEGETRQLCGDGPPICAYADRGPDTAASGFDPAYSTEPGVLPCKDQDATWATAMRADSVLSLDADVAYPNTHVHFVYGDGDCAESASLGWLYFDAIETDKSIAIAVDTPHRTQTTPDGADAITEALIEHCRP